MKPFVRFFSFSTVVAGLLAASVSYAGVVSTQGTVRSSAADLSVGILKLEVDTVIGTRILTLRHDGSQAALLCKGEAAMLTDQMVIARYDTETFKVQSIAPIGEASDDGFEDLKGTFDEAPRTKTWCLLIGVRDYEHLNPLRYTASDASSLADLYRKHGGVSPDRLLLITDDTAIKPTADELNRQVRAFLGRPEISPDDSVIVFFSGHGIRSESSGQGYLMPRDGDPTDEASLEATALRIDELLATMAESQAGHKVLLLDACHSGAFSGQRIREALSETRGVVTLSSCRDDQVSLEDEALGHGIFTALLLEGLRGVADQDYDGIVQFGELHAYLADATVNSVQVPVQYVPPNSSGRPPVIVLDGAARDLSKARREAQARRFEQAMAILTEMGAPEDVRILSEQIDLFSSLADKANGYYTSRLELSVEACRQREADSPEDVKTRVVLHRSLLALAQVHMALRDPEAFVACIEEAKEVADRLQSSDPATYARALITNAEITQQARFRGLFAKPSDRAYWRDRIQNWVLEAREAHWKIPIDFTKRQVRSEVAGAAWRLGFHEIWDEMMDTSPDPSRELLPESPRPRALYLVAAYAEVGDSIGAAKAIEMLKADVQDYGMGEMACLQGMLALASARDPELPTERYEAAIEDCRNTIEQMNQPDSTWTQYALFYLGKAMIEARDFEEVDELIEDLKGSGLFHQKIKAHKAILRANAGETDEAIEELNSVLDALDVEILEACQEIAQAEARRGQQRFRSLLNWIDTLPEEGQQAHAYAGLVLELTNGRQLLADITRPDGFKWDSQVRTVAMNSEDAASAFRPAVYERPSNLQSSQAAFSGGTRMQQQLAYGGGGYNGGGYGGGYNNALGNYNNTINELSRIPYAGSYINRYASPSSIPYVGGYLGGFGGGSIPGMGGGLGGFR